MNGTYPWSFVASTYSLRTFGLINFLVCFNSLFMKAQVWNIYIYIPYAGDVGRLFLTIDRTTKTNISSNVVNTFRSFPYS